MRCRRRPRGLLWPSGGDVETRIADIVGAGFRRWAEFTERFTENEARIRTIDPGAAQWQDLRSLLERSCGAEQGPSATCPIFTLSDYGVDVTHSNVRTLNVFRVHSSATRQKDYQLRTQPVACFNGSGRLIPMLWTRSVRKFRSCRMIASARFGSNDPTSQVGLAQVRPSCWLMLCKG